MRIVHIVTLVSDTGAFGGPLRVALNQVEELLSRGHDVELVAGWQGEGQPPSEVDGIRVTAFPARTVVPRTGFSGLYSLGLQRWLGRHVGDADVVHVHAGRDLVTLAALHRAHSAGVPSVVQSHGMIGIDGRPRARVLDLLATRRLVGAARLHLVLTADEADAVQEVIPGARIHMLHNGVRPLEAKEPAAGSEVLFCARLHPRKRPLAFVEMARRVVEGGRAVEFAMVGPDEGELPKVRRAIREAGLDTRVHYEGALSYGEVAERVGRAAVYVLPSVDEPFPMGMLEAMSLGVASVCTDSCGISEELRQRGAAVVTDGSPAALAEVVMALLDDPAYRADVAERGRTAVAERYSIESVVDELEQCYREVAALSSGRM